MYPLPFDRAARVVPVEIVRARGAFPGSRWGCSGTGGGAGASGVIEECDGRSTAEREVNGEAGIGGSVETWGRRYSEVVRRVLREDWAGGVRVVEAARERGIGGSSSSAIWRMMGVGAEATEGDGWWVLRLRRRPNVVVCTMPRGITKVPTGRVQDVSPVRVW